MHAAQVPFYFVVRFGQSNAGSTRMRSDDLVQIVRPHLGDRLVPRIVTMPGPRFPVLQRIWARSRPRGGIYFLTKSALAIDPEAAATLRARSRGLAFDYIDSDLTKDRSRHADVHVCASYAAQARIHALQAEGAFSPGPTAVILHNASAALYDLPLPARRGFATVYCGTALVTRIPAALAGEIRVIDARNHADLLASLPDLARYPLHYCMRRDKEVSDLLVKPFTKGVTAAMCGANVIVSRDVPDATRLLGDDYPFLAPNTSDAAILEAHARARDGFGGAEWNAGLERLAALKEEVSGAALAARLRGLAELLGVD